MTDHELSRRERQIMDAVFSHEEASANQVLDSIADPPSRTAVRTFLRILVDKGHLTQRPVGREMFYKPTKPRRRAGQSALNRVVETFFDGSLEQAFAAHLADSNADLSDDELKKLAVLIREARKKET
ncbi:MAG: BlaI/MecI/CopY family transcriptional regulator [Fuerstiella sp.]|nr:BlaI/MecI/CopY family transcriptional regulator [Fuerstiella sp.]